MDEAISRVNKWIQNNDPYAYLFLNDLGLTELPPIPTNCRMLKCYNNKLTKLQELPFCEILHCWNNKLTSLPKLPLCVDLCCSGNYLSELPELPVCKLIVCSYNNLSYLPKIPSCEIIFCHENEYLYLNKNQRALVLNEDKYFINYNKSALIIQKAFKKYMRRRYQLLLTDHFHINLAKLITNFV